MRHNLRTGCDDSSPWVVAMDRKNSVPGASGWTITEQGRLDLQVMPECKCNPRLVGLLIECPECGTIYGSLKESTGRDSGAREKHRWD